MVGRGGWADDQSESGSALLDAGRLWNRTRSYFAFVGVFCVLTAPAAWVRDFLPKLNGVIRYR